MNDPRLMPYGIPAGASLPGMNATIAPTTKPAAPPFQAGYRVALPQGAEPFQQTKIPAGAAEAIGRATRKTPIAELAFGKRIRSRAGMLSAIGSYLYEDTTLTPGAMRYTPASVEMPAAAPQPAVVMQETPVKSPHPAAKGWEADMVREARERLRQPTIAEGSMAELAARESRIPAFAAEKIHAPEGPALLTAPAKEATAFARLAEHIGRHKGKYALGTVAAATIAGIAVMGGKNREAELERASQPDSIAR